MKIKTTFLAILIVTTAFLPLFQVKTSALSCLPFTNYTEAMEGVDLVVQATVKNEKKNQRNPLDEVIGIESQYTYMYELEVHKTWKGSDTDKITVFQDAIHVTWSYTLDVGEEAVFFLVGNLDGTFSYPLCGTKINVENPNYQDFLTELEDYTTPPSFGPPPINPRPPQPSINLGLLDILLQLLARIFFGF